MALLSNVTALFWLAAIVVFIVIEAATVGLASIWFAVGAAAALLCAVFHGALWLQVLWFVVVSVAALVITRPLAQRYVNAKSQPTNADRSIGARALVTEAIDNLKGTGAVYLEGKTWTARSVSGAPIPAGKPVIVREIQGVKLLVEPAE